MKLSRELVRRMAGRNGSSSSTSYGGGGGGGGVSPSWVEENYVSKAFFSRLFTIHSATGTITPNDVETSVDNIEALAGFWTDSYVSALGQNSEGGGGGGSSTLAGLLDVALSSPQDGQALVYDADTSKWVNGDVTPDLSLYATKDWVQQQGYLTASDLTGYATQQWVGQQGYLTASALTGYATQQWVGQQGYATQQWVQQQGYLTSSAISDMATMTWVGQQGFAYASDVYSKEAADARFLTIPFFRSLFRARTASGTEVVPNDGDTSTITNIKAMFGFWTEQYVSALGQNSSGGGGGSSTLADLLDVALSSPQDGQVLVYDATTGKWVNGDVSPDLTGYATQQWVQQQGYITSSALTGYATQQWVQQQGYITSSALTGYATQQWVQQQGYLTSSAISDMATKTWVGQQGFAYASDVYSKEAADARFLTIPFFRSLFRARTASGTEVVPNDGDTSTITNIKAMFGFWTEQYVSALGQNSSGGGGGSSTLADLLDVALSSPQDGQALVYDAASGKWVNEDVSPDLTGYATQQWVQQQGYITSSALTGYATQQWVQQQGYITSSAISDMATKTWVGQQGYLTSSAISDMATKTWVGQQGYLTASALTGYATQQWVQQQGYLTSSAISDMATKTWVGQQGFVKTVTGTFWGQPWTNGDTIYGSLSDVCDIDLDGIIRFHYNDATSYTSRLYEDQSGRLKMDAQVYIPSQQSLRIGDAVLSWDGASGALKIQNADGTAGSLYATGGLSALGMSAGASSVERMTFGYVDITNRITFGDNSRYISYDDGIVLHPLSGDNVQVSAQLYVSRGIEVEGNILTDGYDVKLDGGKLYLDTTRYIIVSSGALKYYDGVNLRTISLE